MLTYCELSVVENKMFAEFRKCEGTLDLSPWLGGAWSISVRPASEFPWSTRSKQGKVLRALCCDSVEDYSWDPLVAQGHVLCLSWMNAVVPIRTFVIEEKEGGDSQIGIEIMRSNKGVMLLASLVPSLDKKAWMTLEAQEWVKKQTPEFSEYMLKNFVKP